MHVLLWSVAAVTAYMVMMIGGPWLHPELPQEVWHYGWFWLMGMAGATGSYALLRARRD